MLHRLLATYKNFKPFTDTEAWGLFKFAAFAESIGWTLLILGIACKQLPVAWSQIPVSIAGQIHGMLFLFYIVIVLAVAPSLQWSLFRTFVAGLCSVPPYGSLMYEQISSYYRNRHAIKQLQVLLRYRQLAAI